MGWRRSSLWTCETISAGRFPVPSRACAVRRSHGLWSDPPKRSHASVAPGLRRYGRNVRDLRGRACPAIRTEKADLRPAAATRPDRPASSGACRRGWQPGESVRVDGVTVKESPFFTASQQQPGDARSTAAPKLGVSDVTVGTEAKVSTYALRTSVPSWFPGQRQNQLV